jgi:hypothetical protein
MKIEHRIDKIIETYLPAIARGQETIDSILEKYPKYASALRPRLEAAIWLQQVRLSVSTRPGFINDSRKYMETKIGSMQPIGFWQRLFWRHTPHRWVFNIAAPIIVLLLLALVINSAVLTARLSIPGDPFYSTKLVTENIQLAFTLDPVEKTDLYIQFSRERTTEIMQLVLEGDYERISSAAYRLETELIASLHSINDIASRDPTAEIPMIASFRDTLSNEIFMLSVLKDTSPMSARPGIVMAIQVAQAGMLALH